MLHPSNALATRGDIGLNVRQDLQAAGADRITAYTVAGLFAKTCKRIRATEHVYAQGLGQSAARVNASE